MKANKIIELFNNSTLLRTTIKNASHVILRFVLGFLNIKILAAFIGPQGMAMIGQFQNFLQLGTNISSLGFNNGIVKYLSQYKNSPNKQHIIVSTSFLLISVFAFIIGVIVFLFSNYFSIYIFNTTQYAFLVRFSGVYFFSSSIVLFYMSLLNGKQKLSTFIKINILLSISGFTITALAVYFYKLRGVLWAQILLSLIAFIPAIYVLVRYFNNRKYVFSLVAIKNLGSYSLMALVSGILGPLTFFIIRKIIANNISWDMAGVWEGMNKVSINYIALITMSFSYYFLPTFSKLQSYSAINREIVKSYKILIVVLIIGGLSIYYCRNIIIRLLFAVEFKAMEDLFFWQIIGDFFKILSWVIGYLFIAKEKVQVYIFTEITSVVLQIALATVLIRLGTNITLYYGIENIAYFILMFFCYYKIFQK